MILRTKGVTIGALGTKRHSKEILRETLASQTLAKLLVQVVYFGLGVLASRGTVFGGYSPFGVALAAAAPFPNIIAVTAGTIVGSLLPGAVNEGDTLFGGNFSHSRYPVDAERSKKAEQKPAVCSLLWLLYRSSLPVWR